MIQIDAESIWQDVQAIRARAPLVHNITNYVVMNSTANALLAIGASPVMAHAEEEVGEMVSLASALVINIGTLSASWVRAMHVAMRHASQRGIPVVLDPVGAGATSYRTQTVHELIASTAPQIIRGNASEIAALVSSQTSTKGVDSTLASRSALDAAWALSRSCDSVVSISGDVDYVVWREQQAAIHNGHPMMSRVTGLGCTATALCGAFAAVNPSPFMAAAHAMAVLGIAGEIAAERAEGPGSLQMHLIDALYNLNLQQIAQRLKTGG
ncbi:Hydroxyethylthiazole kinase [bacterium HR16]|nr:Hydroxyethylthiazole kinase [bacterium HR16]